MSNPVGDIVDALGVELTLPEGDLPADAVVLLRCVDSNGHAVLRIGWSDSLDWLTRTGMLHAALRDEEDTVDAGDDGTDE